MGFKDSAEYQAAVTEVVGTAVRTGSVRWLWNVGSTAVLLAVTIAILHYFAVPAWLAISITIAVVAVCVVASITAGVAEIRGVLAIVVTAVEWTGERGRA